MPYFIAFLEGFITFISPCMLPMLPIYISYFTGSTDEKNSKNAFKNSLGFVLGFSVVFITLGALSGGLGAAVLKDNKVFNALGGLLLIIFGVNYTGILKIELLNRVSKLSFNIKGLSFLSSIAFGVVFSIGWSPCIGTFLGSALLLAANQGSFIKGITMLIAYSLGLGIPFVVSAVLIEKLKTTFNYIKKHYTVINIISGLFLIIMGILMATGYLGRFLGLVSL